MLSISIAPISLDCPSQKRAWVIPTPKTPDQIIPTNCIDSQTTIENTRLTNLFHHTKTNKYCPMRV